MKQPQKPRPDAELDCWCWQLQVLDDLAKFVESHGPSSATPLPTVHWMLGFGKCASADLLHSDPNSMDTLTTFARVLGTRVQQQRFIGSVVYHVRGRIGAREGSDKLPRTSILLRMRVILDIDGVEGVS